MIIADECHSHSAKDLSVWRDTLDYFDAIKVGFMATPAPHTVSYLAKRVARAADLGYGARREGSEPQTARPVGQGHQETIELLVKPEQVRKRQQ